MMDGIFIFLIVVFIIGLIVLRYCDYLLARNKKVDKFYSDVLGRIDNKCNLLISNSKYRSDRNYPDAFFDSSLAKYYNKALYSFKDLVLENYFSKEKIDWLNNDKEYWE